jgi:hypothetical protein
LKELRGALGNHFQEKTQVAERLQANESIKSIIVWGSARCVRSPVTAVQPSRGVFAVLWYRLVFTGSTNEYVSFPRYEIRQLSTERLSSRLVRLSLTTYALDSEWVFELLPDDANVACAWFHHYLGRLRWRDGLFPNILFRFTRLRQLRPAQYQAHYFH